MTQRHQSVERHLRAADWTLGKVECLLKPAGEIPLTEKHYYTSALIPSIVLIHGLQLNNWQGLTYSQEAPLTHKKRHSLTRSTTYSEQAPLTSQVDGGIVRPNTADVIKVKGGYTIVHCGLLDCLS